MDKLSNNIETILKQFTEWQPWTAQKTRKVLKLSDPGVYMLAINPLLGKPSLSTEIVYIGETCNQTLYKRLGGFYRSAFPSTNKETHGHSGGRTAWRNEVTTSQSDLLFSVLSVKGNNVEREAYIRYLERTLIWQYVQTNTRLPSCNKK